MKALAAVEQHSRRAGALPHMQVNLWAAWYITKLLIELTLKGVVFSIFLSAGQFDRGWGLRPSGARNPAVG